MFSSPLAEVPCSDTRMQGILDDGIGVVDVSSFMQLIVDKQAGRQVLVECPGTTNVRVHFFFLFSFVFTV